MISTKAMFHPHRSIDSFEVEAYITINETMVDTMVATTHPVAVGTEITDHAYKVPSTCDMEIAWPGSVDVTEIYRRLVELQRNRIRTTIHVGKRMMENMIIISISTTNNTHTEHAFIVDITWQEVIIANVRTYTRPSRPSKNGAIPKGGHRHITGPVPEPVNVDKIKRWTWPSLI